MVNFLFFLKHLSFIGSESSAVTADDGKKRHLSHVLRPLVARRFCSVQNFMCVKIPPITDAAPPSSVHPP